MKKLLFFILFLIASFLISCGDDDDSNTNETKLEGRYDLQAYRTNPPTDINNDGNGSEDQLLETDCHQNTILKLNEDLTYTFDFSLLGLKLDSNDQPTQELECDIENIEGTYEVDGNTIILSFQDLDSTESIILVNNNGVLVSEVLDIDLITRNGEGQLISVDAALVLEFSK